MMEIKSGHELFVSERLKQRGQKNAMSYFLLVRPSAVSEFVCLLETPLSTLVGRATCMHTTPRSSISF